MIKNSFTLILYYLSQKNSSSKSFERQAFSRITFALLHFLQPCSNCFRCFESPSKSPEHINVQILSRAPFNMHLSFPDSIFSNPKFYVAQTLPYSVYDIQIKSYSCLSPYSIISKISKTKSGLYQNNTEKIIQKHWS